MRELREQVLATAPRELRRLSTEPSGRGAYGAEPMRLIVARCEVEYSGRLTARLPEALRLLMLKADGSVLVHADTGGYKPLNWMTPPTVDRGVGRTGSSCASVKGEDRLDIGLAEVLSDVTHDMARRGGAWRRTASRRELQELLADAPEWCGEGFRLVRREWPTDIGPVDLMCRDDDDGWIAVEIKRVGTIDAVEQLSRYLERIRLDPAMADCRGVLAAQVVKPQARVLAEARGIDWVEVDLAVLRGEREPDAHAVRLRACSPNSVASSDRGPPWSRCSHRYTPCHVPSASRPSLTGSDSDGPSSDALMCAGMSSGALERVGPAGEVLGHRVRRTTSRSRAARRARRSR